MNDKPLGFIILAVILVVVVGLTLACCYWCPDYYFSGCTPADILGKKKPSARPLESTPLIVTIAGAAHWDSSFAKQQWVIVPPPRRLP